MKRTLVFMFALVSLVLMSAPAFAESSPSSSGDSALVRLKDRVYGFLEDPVLYESGNVTLKMGAGVRIRVESYSHDDNGLLGPAEYSDTYFAFRTTVSLDLQAGDAVEALIEGLDAEVGSYPADEPSRLEDSLDLHRFWVEIHPENWPISFRIGRQYVKIADGWLVGPSDWDQVPRTFDAFHITYDGGEQWAIHLFVGLPVWPDDNNFDEATYHEDPTLNDDFTYAALWGGYKFVEEFALGAYVIMKVDDNSQTQGEDGFFDDYRVYTYGLRGYGKVYGLDYGAQIAVQGGNRGTDDIEAFGADVRVKYDFDYKMNPSLRAFYTYASGDDNNLDGKCKTFDPLLGDVADRYGKIHAVGLSNIEIIGFGGSLEPIERLTVNLDFFYYQRPERNDAWYDQYGKVYLTGVFDSSTVGNEVNLEIAYKLDEFFTFTLGYASFFGSNFLDDKGMSDNADYLYFTVDFRF